MTTYDITLGLADQNFQKMELQHTTMSRTVDFSKFTTAGVAGAAADIAKIITLPANFVLEDVFYKVITPSTTSSSVFGCGDSSDGVLFLPATTSATATAGTIGKTTAYSGKFHDLTSVTTALQTLTKTYSSADYISVTLGSTAPLNGVVTFYVRGFHLV